MEAPRLCRKTAIYRRKLPHIERRDGSYFITLHTKDDLTLNDEAKWLFLDHCLYDDGKGYELDSPWLGGE